MIEILETTQILYRKSLKQSGINCLDYGCELHPWDKYKHHLYIMVFYKIITPTKAIELLKKQNPRKHTIIRVPSNNNKKSSLTISQPMIRKEILTADTHYLIIGRVFKHCPEILQFAVLRSTHRLHYYILFFTNNLYTEKQHGCN